MENRIVIVFLVGISVASVKAFDGYNPEYSYKTSYDALNELKKIRAEKKAEQKQARKQHADLSWQVYNRHFERQPKKIDWDPKWTIFDDYRRAATPREAKTLSRLDDKLSNLYTQVEDLDKQYQLQSRQYQAQIYDVPGYERFLTGKITGPSQTARSMAKGFRSWIASKWYGTAR